MSSPAPLPAVRPVIRPISRRLPEALNWAERTTLAALVRAAEGGRPCPTNLDLEELCGYNSCSMGPVLIKRLETRGLIKVTRTQKYRIVEIVGTGLTTARSGSMHCDRPHVPKGTYPLAAAIASAPAA